jgi:hypothetical protein
MSNEINTGTKYFSFSICFILIIGLIMFVLVQTCSFFFGEDRQYAMSSEDQRVYFKALERKIFVGRNHKRPFIISCENRVWNGKQWIKFKDVK